ncbi:MAG TPA: sigma-70 family RNA polymerase sigma factor [Bacillota bacterium]|jgi:RNA polymerase sigma-70 factor (ECF subfamily)|nr:sigma-70 family RNA polymerase sigma factor [Bacillota bacterium]HOL09118.1 sigma-70 family RNA polymerase sigma factor [Bacillota bacterium]HPO97175.1 sigma-70 family RNA polymerase sigma factor [Bacillota bacterium]
MNESIIKKQLNDSDDDRQLISRFIAGDIRSFDELVLKYQDPVYRLCLQILGNSHDAEDCAQEVFIKVYHNLKSFKFEAKFSTWLYRVVVNTCKNKNNSLEFRLRKLYYWLDKPEAGIENAYLPELKSNIDSPAQAFERQEVTRAICEAIQSLPLDQKTLIVLFDFEGKTYTELVAITGYKMGTVKSKLARAREKLRSKLEGVID